MRSFFVFLPEEDDAEVLLPEARLFAAINPTSKKARITEHYSRLSFVMYGCPLTRY
jgi:hypothetical protein